MHENVMQWAITYAGMTRYHRQEWQAQWQYTYALKLYEENIMNGKTDDSAT